MSSCVNKYHGQKLSVFSINSKIKNNKIIDRFPDYGDGRRDGCVVMSEMQIDLDTRGQTIVSGIVRDVTTKASLDAATIKVLTRTGEDTVLLSNKDGKFVFYLEDQLSRLEITYIGYRNLVVKF
jgi:hypothetical protein